jgi:hypothetical protein
MWALPILLEFHFLISDDPCDDTFVISSGQEELLSHPLNL